MINNLGDNQTAVLLVTDKSSIAIIHLFKELELALSGVADVIITYHQKEELVPEVIERENHFIFRDNILTQLGYIPLGEKLIPGNNHFPLLKFYKEEKKYLNYWVIEDDVRYTGNWHKLFESANLINADFVSSVLINWEDDRQWYWWKELKHDIKVCPIQKRVASFNPIYRISYDALSFIDFCLKDKWRGHHEVLLPSLLKHGGYKIADFGGMEDMFRKVLRISFITRQILLSMGCVRMEQCVIDLLWDILVICQTNYIIQLNASMSEQTNLIILVPFVKSGLLRWILLQSL